MYGRTYERVWDGSSWLSEKQILVPYLKSYKAPLSLQPVIKFRLSAKIDEKTRSRYDMMRVGMAQPREIYTKKAPGECVQDWDKKGP